MKKYFANAWEVAILMCACIASAFVLCFILWAAGCFNQPEPEPVVVLVEQESAFDTSALEGWCGEPVGHIRMVGAWYYEDGVLEDETGNLWGWDGPVDENGFFLLWIDDMGDDIVENDEIIKLWQEI